MYQRKNCRENGGSSAQIFPKPLHNEVWKKQKFPFFPKVFGESSGVKSWLKTPIFPMISFGGDQVPKFYLDEPPPRPPKIWWPGQGPFRTKIPKIHWEEAATQTIGKLAGFQARLSPELSPRILAKTKCWLESPQSSLKVTIGQLGGFSAQIFARALPKDFWQQRKCWLESPQSSLWFPLAWVAGAQNSPNLLGGQATIGKMGRALG